MANVELKVPGMSCGHCEAAVKDALGALGGIAKVDVDLTTKIVDVDFDGNKVALAAIKEAIEEEGYDIE